MLIAQFEARWADDVAHMTPREVVQFLMEQNNLAQKDLIAEFGTSSRVSEFLLGRRGLSLEQARRLSRRFKLNISLFIENTGKSVEGKHARRNSRQKRSKK
jgi:antitoxin component HigA of HigAB toxin-antitoxin module